MSNNNIDHGRRRFLTASATVVGAAGAVFVSVPFVASMMPSERAKAAGAPVEADISKLEMGQLMRVMWRGKPVWVLRRSAETLGFLKANAGVLSDPNSDKSVQPSYAKNETRAIKPEYLVTIGICTHLGCSPTHRPEIGPADLGGDWKGGFFCPCHGSKFDLAGRVFAGVPAPTNLEIPPYMFLSDTTILIGEDKGAA